MKSVAQGPWRAIQTIQTCFQTGVPSLLAMSGTPITIGPADIEGVVRCLKDPKVDGVDPHGLTAVECHFFKNYPYHTYSFVPLITPSSIQPPEALL